MSGTTFNVTTNRAANESGSVPAGAGAGGNSSGGLLEHFVYTPTGTANTTSTSFVDVTGMVTQNFDTPVTGDHLFILNAQGYRTTGTATQLDIGLSIDGVDYNLQGMAIDETGERHSLSDSVIVSLAAGPHTIKPRWRSGNGAQINTADPWTIDLIAVGSAASSFVGSIQRTQSLLGSDFTVTQAWSNVAGGNLAQVSSVQCTITTSIANEVVEVSYSGSAQVITSSDIIVGYQVDSNTAVPVLYENTGSTEYRNISFVEKVTIATPGSHTIKLMAASNGTDPVITGNNNLNLGALEVTQYGGGAKLVQNTQIDVVSDYNVTSTSYTSVTGALATFTTVPNETVLVTLSDYAYIPSPSLGGSLFIAYSLDAGPDIEVLAISEPNTTILAGNISFTLPLTIVSAGVHTVQLRAKKGAGDNWRLNATGSPLKLSVMQFGGNNQATSWVAFTPTGSWNTNVTYSGQYQIINNVMELSVTISLTGAPNNAALTVNMPSGWDIDSTKLPLAGSLTQAPLGSAYLLDTGTNLYQAHAFYNNDVNLIQIRVFNSAGTYTNWTDLSTTVPHTWANTDIIGITARIPVVAE